MTLSGLQLRVGDTIKVWWKPGQDTITGLTPYKGPLSSLWGGKARLASFALYKVGMTIEPQMMYEVISRTS